MRSSVDLPQPEGPDDDDELAVGDFGGDPVDHLEVAVALADVAEFDFGHVLENPVDDVGGGQQHRW